MVIFSLFREWLSSSWDDLIPGIANAEVPIEVKPNSDKKFLLVRIKFRFFMVFGFPIVSFFWFDHVVVNHLDNLNNPGFFQVVLVIINPKTWTRWYTSFSIFHLDVW